MSKQNKKIFKYLIIPLILIIITGTFVLYKIHSSKEKDIAYKGYSWNIEEYKVSDENVKIKYNVLRFEDIVNIQTNKPFTEQDKNKDFTLTNIEDLLNIKLLKNPKLKSEPINVQNLTINDNKLSSILFRQGKETLTGIEEGITYFINLKTQFASEEEIKKPFTVIDDRTKFIKYHINSLDTDAYIYSNDLEDSQEETNTYPKSATATFPYNGIAYTIKIQKLNYKPEDFYPILESFAF